MHFSDDARDKALHQPDIENGVGSANGSIMVASEEGRVQRTKIVVVGLGMVALSFMCVLPETCEFRLPAKHVMLILAK